MIDLENIQSQMKKGILEYCILSIIKARDEVYSSDILETLKEARIIVVEGTIYPLLTRLRKGGLLEYRWVESTEGPPRKYYKLTTEGENFHSILKQTWEELSSAIQTAAKTEKQGSNE